MVDLCLELENKSIFTDIDLWINFAKEKYVEELLLNPNIEDDTYCVPQCLFACSSLKVLSLKICEFTVTRNVQWNQLKSLITTECYGVTEHAINQILSGSPLLEVLKLSFADRGENLNIQSTSLKELSICKYIYEQKDISLVSELTIWTPNLEMLKIKGIPYTNCWLIDFEGISSVNGFLSPQDYFGDRFSQFLHSIQHVERVKLSFCCSKVLRAMKKRCMHSCFANVKSLKIRYCYVDYGLLENFPQLERLVLLDEKDCTDDPEAGEFETSIPKSFLMQLRTIKVTWFRDVNIFPVIENLLKYASKLEKMVFQTRGTGRPKFLLWASSKLLNMPRSSANCKIVFLYD